MYDFRACAETYDELPVLFNIGALEIRWLGAMVDGGFEMWVSDLSQGGWGLLEGCGWQEVIPEDIPFFDDAGGIKPAWEKAMVEAAKRLGQRGRECGPESNPSIWASWIIYSLSVPCESVRTRFEL